MKNFEQEKLTKTLRVDGRESTVFTKATSDSELTECFHQQKSALFAVREC